MPESVTHGISWPLRLAGCFGSNEVLQSTHSGRLHNGLEKGPREIGGLSLCLGRSAAGVPARSSALD